MNKRIIVIEIGGRQSEDMGKAEWAVKNIVSQLGGYNEAFTVNVSEKLYEELASDESAVSI